MRCLPKDTLPIPLYEKHHRTHQKHAGRHYLLTDYSQAAIFLHEELGGAQAMGGALIVAANLLA